MALTTTPGDAAADSYFTLDEAAAYFTARGVTAWAGAVSDTVRENAARRGTTSLDNLYRGRWVGIAATAAQTLAWPRVDGYRNLLRAFTYPLIGPEGFEIPANVVPAQVKTAAMEAALLVLAGVTLEPTLERGGQIKSISKGVGPLSKSITYMDGAPSVDRYLVIEDSLRGLVNSTPGAMTRNVPVVRS